MTLKTCKSRYARLLKEKKNFTSEELKYLEELYRRYKNAGSKGGPNWVKIGEELGTDHSSVRWAWNSLKMAKWSKKRLVPFEPFEEEIMKRLTLISTEFI